MNALPTTEWVSYKGIAIILPPLVMFAISMLSLLIKVFSGNREPRPGQTLAIHLIAILGAVVAHAALFGASFHTKTMAFSNALVVDGMSVWMSYLVYLITAVSLGLAYDHIATKGHQFTEFCFLVVSSAVGMITLIMANDLIVTFIGIEMMSLCLYILVAMNKEEILAKEGAFKYFVLGSFASAIFLYGIAFIYGTVGSTYLNEIAAATPQLLGTNRMFLVGIGLLVLGFAFKVSIFPLHAWTPDVYQGAATPLTAFMSTAVKAATFVAFLRLFSARGFADSPHLYEVLAWLAVLTMTVGNVAAIMQNNFKRMLAYSSVAHSGYLMIGVIAAGFGSNYEGAATSVIFYLVSYSLMTLGSFALIGLYEKNENTSLQVSDLRGLGRKQPALALSLTILMLSLAGVPPTLGFFGKFYVFSAAIEQDMYWLVLWGVVNSVISVYYYLRPVVAMYFSEDEETEIMPEHVITRGAVMLSAVSILVVGIFSSPLMRAVKKSVLNLF